MSLTEPIQLLFDAAALGALLFLVSSGLSMIFGLMRIVNVAHGSFYMLGAYIAFGLLRSTGNQVTAYALAVLLVAMLGALLYSLLVERVQSDSLRQILLTFGFVLIIGDISLLLWSGVPAALPVPTALEGRIYLGTIAFPAYRAFVIAVGVVAAIMLDMAQRRTRIGAMIRAGADDLTMLACMGINIRLLFVSVFTFGSALAGLGGVLGGMFLGVYPGIDLDIGTLAFVIVIVGGLGNMRGTFAASMLVALLDNVSKAYFPATSLFAIYLLLVVVLAFRPTGLFAQRRIA